jgi:hypothetical protein
MNDIAHRLRESAKETFYDPLKSELNEAASHIEKLEAALTHIWAWYPISVSKPHETIDAIKDYAFAAIRGEIKND